MREILFRGKRVDDGEWVEGMLAYFFDNPKNAMIMPSCYFGTRDFGEEDDNGNPVIEDDCALGGFIRVCPETVGQLRHKKGDVKYFDGDIYYHAGYGLETVSDLCELQMALITGNESDIGEIKGNIHDNPEIL